MLPELYLCEAYCRQKGTTCRCAVLRTHTILTDDATGKNIENLSVFDKIIKYHTTPQTRRYTTL